VRFGNESAHSNKGKNEVMKREQMKRARNVSSFFPTETKGIWRGQYLPPQGKLKASFDEAHEAGCLQAETNNPTFRERFPLLMIALLCNPCDGCPIWEQDGPACECFQKYHTAMANAEIRITAERGKAHVKTTEKCSVCGFKIKGANHEEGIHHKAAVAKITEAS
jgi:hypothetical protein